MHKAFLVKKTQVFINKGPFTSYKGHDIFSLLLNQCYMVLFYLCTNRFQWMIGSDYLRYDLLYIQSFVVSSYKCLFFQFKERLKDVLKPCHDDFYLLRWLRGIFISALHKVKYMYFWTDYMVTLQFIDDGIYNCSAY